MVMTREYAHAIAGYGLEVYFINAIESVLAADDSNALILVCPTGGICIGDLQSRYASNKRVIVFADRCKEDFGAIVPLYDAYSTIFEFCSNVGISYLNMMQNDMQLIWWDAGVVEGYKQILRCFDNAVVLQTGLPRFGSHPDHYSLRTIESVSKYDESVSVQVSRNTAWCDWGFFVVDRVASIENIDIWSSSEPDIGKSLLDSGYVLPFAEIPAVAPIPWPAYTRNGVQYGNPVSSEYPIVVVKDGLTLTGWRHEGVRRLWQEDWITGNGWWCLEPHWCTQPSYHYSRIQIEQTKQGLHRRFMWSRHNAQPVEYIQEDQLHRPSVNDFVLYLRWCTSLGGLL
jgi:hypothetical protein